MADPVMMKGPFPPKSPWGELGVRGSPAGYMVDPGAGSASDRFSRQWPEADQLADIHHRGGSITPLWPRKQVADANALADELASLERRAATLRELLASYGQSDFAEAAAGEYGEDLLGRLVTVLLDAEHLAAALRQPVEAPEPVAWLYERLFLGVPDRRYSERRWDALRVEYEGWTEEPLYRHPPVEAPVDLREALVRVKSALDQQQKWETHSITGERVKRIAFVQEGIDRIDAALATAADQPKISGKLFWDQKPPFISAPEFETRDNPRTCVNGVLYLRADFAAQLHRSDQPKEARDE